MTIKELKEKIKDLPDYATIYAYSKESGCDFDLIDVHLVNCNEYIIFIDDNMP